VTVIVSPPLAKLEKFFNLELLLNCGKELVGFNDIAEDSLFFNTKIIGKITKQFPNLDKSLRDSHGGGFCS
jgi:hypothetical protein